VKLRTIISLPDDLWKKAKIRAVEERVSLAEVVRRALEAYLNLKMSIKGKKTKVKEKKEVGKNGSLSKD
jgi:hypothetical protein